MVDRTIREVIGEQVFETVTAAVARALDGEEITYEYSLTDQTGTTRYARSTLVP